MEHSSVRILSIEINHFKNVEHGSFSFCCDLKSSASEQISDILGVYGQNGSGKTALICAMDIIRILLSGGSLPQNMEQLITVGQENCNFIFFFYCMNHTTCYKIKYEVTITRKDFSDHLSNTLPVYISYERLSYSEQKEKKWSPMQPIFAYTSSMEEIFTPKSRFHEITGKKKERKESFWFAKKYALRESTSYIFCEETRNLIQDYCSEAFYADIIFYLWNFSKYHFYVISERSLTLINTSSFYQSASSSFFSINTIPLKLEGSSLLEEELFPYIKTVISTINLVLNQLIPSLTLELVFLGKQLQKNGKRGILVELAAKHNYIKIPLRYESEGNKRIISVLYLLILVYNNPFTTVAIDELDSGVFEYLLGELLKILEESGKGQLIFTSHNFRPLETLQQTSILFTTSNPQNRYIRLNRSHKVKNFRDFYYHDLILGGQKECIYEPTNRFAISRAFRLAGDSYKI